MSFIASGVLAGCLYASALFIAAGTTLDVWTFGTALFVCCLGGIAWNAPE